MVIPPLSKTTQLNPYFFASIPAARPEGPAPTTMTSNTSLLIRLLNKLLQPRFLLSMLVLTFHWLAIRRSGLRLLHAANVNTGIDSVRLHANAIAENSAPGKWTAWINRNDCDCLMFLPVCCGQAIDERTFSGTWTARHSNDPGVSGVREQLLKEDKTIRRAIFNARDDSRERASVAFKEVFEEVVCHCKL